MRRKGRFATARGRWRTPCEHAIAQWYREPSRPIPRQIANATTERAKYFTKLKYSSTMLPLLSRVYMYIELLVRSPGDPGDEATGAHRDGDEITM